MRLLHTTTTKTIQQTKTAKKKVFTFFKNIKEIISKHVGY